MTANARSWSELDKDRFKGTARNIARSVKRLTERNKWRRASPYRSAMSKLALYENRAGSNLPASRKRTLDAAKRELRKLYKKRSRR